MSSPQFSVKSVLQTVFQNIFYFACTEYNDDDKQTKFVNKICESTKCFNARLIQIRGDGLCMLYAFCAYRFLKIHNFSVRQLESVLEENLNKKYIEDKIPEHNCLNQDITSYCESSLQLVLTNFNTISNLVIKILSDKHGWPKDVCKKFYGFKGNMEPSNFNYSFYELGMVLSCQYETIIINITTNDETVLFYGVKPFDIDKDEIQEKVNSDELDVVFIFNKSNRHYYSFIPIEEGDSEDALIKDLGKKFFNKIYDQIKWFLE
jgi:hypothetical protein